MKDSTIKLGDLSGASGAAYTASALRTLRRRSNTKIIIDHGFTVGRKKTKAVYLDWERGEEVGRAEGVDSRDKTNLR